MNKQDFIRIISKKRNLPQLVVDSVIDDVLAEIKKAVANGDKVTFANFGGFALRQRAARPGRDPRNGEPLNIPARSIPYFRPFDDFKRRAAKRSDTP